MQTTAAYQGFVLGPTGFIAYAHTEDAADIINRNGVWSHFYADDMQLYTSCHPDNISDMRSNFRLVPLTSCNGVHLTVCG
jgi:hypothetical protein